jgi:hypothetical protein
MVAHGICTALADFTETVADLAPYPPFEGNSDDNEIATQVKQSCVNVTLSYAIID